MQGGSTGNGSSEETFDDVLPRSERLLEYLEAVLALKERPVRDLQQYKEKVWWVDELPQDTACLLGGGDEDAWLRLSKVLLPQPPPVPPDLAGYVAEGPSMDEPPVLREPFLEANQDGFADGAAGLEARGLQERLDQWIVSEWEPWAMRTHAARSARRLYREIYDLYLRLQRDEAAFEFIWGHGLLTWQVGREVVRHPIVTTRMSVSFDEVSGDLVVAPDDATQVEIEFLQGLDIGGMPFLIELQRRFEEAPSDPWAPEEAMQLFEDFVTRLPVAGVVSDRVEAGAASSTPTLMPSSMFFMRRRNTMYRAFLAALRERLATPGGLLTGPLASVVSSRPSQLLMPDDDGLREDWSVVGEELLLPTGISKPCSVFCFGSPSRTSGRRPFLFGIWPPFYG